MIGSLSKKFFKTNNTFYEIFSIVIQNIAFCIFCVGMSIELYNAKQGVHFMWRLKIFRLRLVLKG